MNIKKLLSWNAEDSEKVSADFNPPRPPSRPRKEITPISMLDMSTMAQAVAKSGMFGVRDEAQALSLMLLCQAEGLHPVLALRRYHIIEGKPSMRADALQGEFEQAGAILWHERTETECSATFFREKRQVNNEALKRARLRYDTLKAGRSIASLSELGEMTIIRTIEDAVEKKVAMSWNKDAGKWVLKHNWKQSPRQMLHARCLSEGVRAIAPGLIAGIYTEDEALDVVESDGAELMTPEDRVRTATEHRTSATVDAEIIPDVNPITEENYGEVVCHIGDITKDAMRDKKVSEIHPTVLTWLQKNYGERWGKLPSGKDLRLKEAVDIALRKLEAE